MKQKKSKCANLVLIAAIFTGIHMVESKIRITPEHAHVASKGQVSVQCKAQVPLSACHFRVRHGNGDKGLLMDFSKGQSSATLSPSQVRGHQPEGKRQSSGLGAYTAKYCGRGLDSGDCGVTLSNLVDGAYIVGCLVRDTVGGQWMETMSLLVRGSAKETDMSIEPRHAVVLPGKDLTILCKTGTKLAACSFTHPSNGLLVDMNNPQGRYRYHGRGLEHGHCGLTIFNVTEGDNGVFWCLSSTASQGGLEGRASIVVVAAEPEHPFTFGEYENGDTPLCHTMPIYIQAGEELVLACTSKQGRPVPELYWMLGSDIIRPDNVDLKPNVTWQWPWELQTVRQTLRRKVTWKDSGKKIKCVAKQPELNYLKVTPDKIINIGCNNYAAFPAIKYDYSAPTTESPYQEPKCILVYHGAGARPTDIGSNPWHAGIYERDTPPAVRKKETYSQICGGTVLTKRYIVSAAHCIWDEALGRAVNANKYKVAVGKYKRDWSHISEEEQRFGVETIFAYPRYLGFRGHFQYDIALLRLDGDIDFFTNVQPACVDWESAFHLEHGNNGTVAGWGINEKGIQPDGLESNHLPYVGADTCFDLLHTSSKHLLTQDKFCAGFTNKNISVCRGDSGGGIFFEQPDVGAKFLRGIVSTSFQPEHIQNIPCYVQQVTGFTAIHDYIPWIRNITGVA